MEIMKTVEEEITLFDRIEDAFVQFLLICGLIVACCGLAFWTSSILTILFALYYFIHSAIADIFSLNIYEVTQNTFIYIWGGLTIGFAIIFFIAMVIKMIIE